MRLPTTAALVLALSLPASACGGGRGTGPARLVRIPSGASFGEVTDSLAAHDLVSATPLFRVYARFRGADRRVKPGTYRFREGAGWGSILDDLDAGRIVTQRLVLPEVWDTPDVARRIARVSGRSPDSVLFLLTDTAAASRYGVPGPSLEGYLYPATYTFPVGVSLDSVLGRVTSVYGRVWTPERQALADSAGMSRRDATTLASIVEKEAKRPDEMPRIASVYRNRLRLGMPLQADPTVQYALGAHRPRLTYAAIDSVADNPYNTYTHPGLPPGPIASPNAAAIDAVLDPDTTRFLYFVAKPDGSHIFSRTLAEHNRAKQQVHRMSRDSAARR